MRNYKLVVLLKSNLKKEQKNKLINDIKIWAGSVKNDKVTEIGEKKLAYPIKKASQGELVMLEFDQETMPTEFERRLAIQDDILRHLLVRMK